MDVIGKMALVVVAAFLVSLSVMFAFGFGGAPFGGQMSNAPGNTYQDGGGTISAEGAEAYDSSKASHGTLYVNTIASKSGSPIQVEKDIDISVSGVALVNIMEASSSGNIGLKSLASSSDGYARGVWGETSRNTADSAGIYGYTQAASAYAGLFQGGQGVKIVGDLEVTGTCTGCGGGDSYWALEDDDSISYGGGSGKIDVGLVDPVYNIDGTKYATYGLSSVGVWEEVIGVAQLTADGDSYSYTVDFGAAEEGSDLWLFYSIIDQDMGSMSVLLTPGSDSNVWYVKEPENSRLVFYSNAPTEVSYRLSSPRFDHEEWGNLHPNQELAGIKIKGG